VRHDAASAEQAPPVSRVAKNVRPCATLSPPSSASDRFVNRIDTARGEDRTSSFR
jgi:hypothetical protein